MRISVPLAAALVAAFAGCQQHDAPAAAKSTPDPAPAVTDDRLLLLTAGGEAKRELRYHPAKSTSTPFELAVDLDMELGAVAAAAGGKIPTLVLTGSLVVDDLLPSGDAAVHFQLEHASARPHPGSSISPDQIAAGAKPFEGLVERATMSPTGRLRDPSVEAPGLPASAKDQLKTMADQLDQVTVALPAQAVGVGAKWKQTKAVVTSGVHMDTTLTYEVTAMDGDHISYTVSAQVTGADQHASFNGLELDVRHIAGSGGGKGVIDLASGAVTGTFTTAFHVDLGGETPASLGMAMTVAISRPQ